MITIAFLIEKGGVGKTTLSTHLAAALAIRGYTTLLIDADPQANLTTSLGLPRLDGLARILHDYDDPADNHQWADVVKQLDPARWAGEPPAGHLWIVPGHPANYGIPYAVRDTNRLRDRQAELAQVVDVIIYDTPPTINMLHSLMYRAADYVVIPTQLEDWSYAGVTTVTDLRITEENKFRIGAGLRPLELMGIQPTMTKRSIVHEDTIARLIEKYDDKVWQPIADRPTRWGSAVKNRKTVFANEPHCKAEDEIWIMADNAHDVIRHHHPEIVKP